jgi:hypothetical protein
VKISYTVFMRGRGGWVEGQVSHHEERIIFQQNFFDTTQLPFILREDTTGLQSTAEGGGG